MEGAREYLDLAADVALFIAALSILFSGFSKVWRIQASQAEPRLEDAAYFRSSEAGSDGAYAGSELIVRLMDASMPIEVDGETYAAGQDASVAIRVDAAYRVNREYDGSGTFPSRIVLTTVAED